ncbi:MAG: hypothetical protein LC134_09940 [Chitinophagales bacterium]|nr:hypothetical protein [Chitinophagaceae bacterium]MCZ2299784.1 hypothetical protein [Chitinophagales bacterium]
MLKRSVSIMGIIFLFACNNYTTIKENSTTPKATFLGLWNVNYITETDFAIEDGDTLKGPFVDTVKNTTIYFTKDSIVFSQIDADTLISKYIYQNINNSVLKVVNTATKDSMKIYIQYVDSLKLQCKNVRNDERRGNKYEVQLNCNKILKN